MSTAIKLSDHIINEVKKVIPVSKRSIPKQIEYWAYIGKIAEENQDLPYSFIKDILLSLEEEKQGQFEPYHFG